VRSQLSTHQNKSRAFFEASPESQCRWRKKNVSKVRKIPLVSNTTKGGCVDTSADWLKQLLDKRKKDQLFAEPSSESFQ